MTLIYSHPVAATFFWSTYLAFVLLDARLVTNSLAGRAAPDHDTTPQGLVHRPAGLVWIIVAEALGLATAAVEGLLLPWRWLLLALGLAMTWLGLALRFSAKRALGRFFVGAVVVQDAHPVITTGRWWNEIAQRRFDQPATKAGSRGHRWTLNGG
ncbi:MAG TPA: hypothetical protein VFH23_05455 [Jiangellaceae bacterium]|nr:hypothetical protein [Jiangellaceae bacterium]